MKVEPFTFNPNRLDLAKQMIILTATFLDRFYDAQV